MPPRKVPSSQVPVKVRATPAKRGAPSDSDGDASGSDEQEVVIESTQRKEGLTVHQRQQLATDLLRFVLFNENQRLTVSRTKINDVILPQHKGQRATTAVLQEATAVAKSVFGFELTGFVRESQKKKKKSKTTSTPGVPSDYVLLTQRPPAPQPPADDSTDAQKAQFATDVVSFDSAYRNQRKLISWRKDGAQLAMTMLILSLIEIEQHLDEDTLWRHLEKLDLTKNTKNHVVFGDVRQLVETKLPKYISRVRNPQSNMMEYTRGPRSQVEITPLDVTRFMYKVVNREPDAKVLQRVLERGIEKDDESSSEEDEDGTAAATQGE